MKQLKVILTICCVIILFNNRMVSAGISSGETDSTKMKIAVNPIASVYDSAAMEARLPGWGLSSQKAAFDMISKYGEPNETTDNMLIWYKNGQWVKTIVYKEEIDHNFPIEHKDVLEQFAEYNIKPDRVADLLNFNGSIKVDRTKGEISSRCDREDFNITILNLANDIDVNKKTVDVARKYYTDYVKDLIAVKTGIATPKLQFFGLIKGVKPDADKVAIDQQEIKSITAKKDSLSNPNLARIKKGKKARK